MSEGFITLHRSVQKHWIWQEPEALKFWVALLLQAMPKSFPTTFICYTLCAHLTLRTVGRHPL